MKRHPTRLGRCSVQLSLSFSLQICFQMLQSVIYRGIRLPKHCLKDFHFLSRTFADLPNIRGDGQKTPAKPPNSSPVQQNADSPSSVEQQNDGPSSPAVRSPEPVLPGIRLFLFTFLQLPSKLSAGNYFSS